MDAFDDIDMDDAAGMEVQSLMAIFDSDLVVKEKKPWVFSLVLKPTSEEKDNHVAVRLNVELPNTYPEVVPQIIVQLEKGLNTKHRDSLQKTINKMAEECVGMEMMYDITEAVKEYLVENNKVEKSEYEQMVERMASGQAEKESEEDLKKKEARAKLEYKSSLEWVEQHKNDNITRDNFQIWKDLFDAQGNTNTTISFEVVKVSPVTGRELFERDLKLGIAEETTQQEGDPAVFYFNENLYDDDELDDIDLEEDKSSTMKEKKPATTDPAADIHEACEKGSASSKQASSEKKKKPKSKKKKKKAGKT